MCGWLVGLLLLTLLVFVCLFVWLVGCVFVCLFVCLVGWLVGCRYVYSVLRRVHRGRGGGSAEEALAARRVYVAPPTAGANKHDVCGRSACSIRICRGLDSLIVHAIYVYIYCGFGCVCGRVCAWCLKVGRAAATPQHILALPAIWQRRILGKLMMKSNAIAVHNFIIAQHHRQQHDAERPSMHADWQNTRW